MRAVVCVWGWELKCWGWDLSVAMTSLLENLILARAARFLIPKDGKFRCKNPRPTTEYLVLCRRSFELYCSSVFHNPSHQRIYLGQRGTKRREGMIYPVPMQQKKKGKKKEKRKRKEKKKKKKKKKRFSIGLGSQSTVSE